MKENLGDFLCVHYNREDPDEGPPTHLTGTRYTEKGDNWVISFDTHNEGTSKETLLQVPQTLKIDVKLIGRGRSELNSMRRARLQVAVQA